jgi:hypothetical protein
MPITASRQRETGGSAEHFKPHRRFRAPRGPDPKAGPDHPSATDLLRPVGPNLGTEVWTLGLDALAMRISDDGSAAPTARFGTDRMWPSQTSAVPVPDSFADQLTLGV